MSLAAASRYCAGAATTPSPLREPDRYREAVASLLETLWAMGQDIVLQEYIRESKGRDIRALVVGDRVVTAMRRQARRTATRPIIAGGGR